MIKVWDSTEKIFNGNKYVLNESTKAEVTEVVNGEFSLDLEYPLQDTKKLSRQLLRGNIITCPVSDGRADQQFRIRKAEKTSSNVIVYAQSKLAADLTSNRIKPMTIIGKTRRQAIDIILKSALDGHSFYVGNLDNNNNTNVILEIKEGSVLNALIGSENSVLSEYGGEFVINNNEFNIIDSRGSKNNFTIAYGKNISSIKETIDDTDLATVLIPKSGDYRLPEYYVQSPKVNNYEKKYFKEVDMKFNIWDGKDEKGNDQITETEAYTLMRVTCNNMFLVDKIDQVAFNYDVDLVCLRKTEEYKNYNILEKCYLGDTVKIKHKLLNLDLEGRVNKTVYNALLDKYLKVEIGFSKQDITDVINTAVKNITFSKEEILLQVSNMQKNLNSKLEIQEDKINAVVENNGTGMGWQLNQDAFVVACKGASAASVKIDGEGLTVEDGKFKVKDGGSTVFYVNRNGTCTADGGFVVEDDSISCEIGSEGITLTGENGSEAKIEILDDGTYSGTYIRDDLYVEDVLRVFGTCKFESGFISYEDVTVEKDLYVEGDLDVEGSKPCLQSTKNYGKRRVTAYETAEYYFGDIGSGIIKNGECIVTIEDIFSECVNTDIEYQVFTQSYNGKITKIERYPAYFIVYGDNNTGFGWEIKAKRKGWENTRLEVPERIGGIL